MLNSFYNWLESCFAWFFPASLLTDPFIALIIKGLEFFGGLWFLYLLVFKPILCLLYGIERKIFGGR